MNHRLPDRALESFYLLVFDGKIAPFPVCIQLDTLFLTNRCDIALLAYLTSDQDQGSVGRSKITRPLPVLVPNSDQFIEGF